MTFAEAANTVVSSGAGGGLQFDATISAGSILTIITGSVVWLVTITVAWTKFGGRMDMLEFRTERVENAMEKIAVALDKLSANEVEVTLLKQEIAAQQQQIATLHSTVEGMRKGEGFITGPRRGNLIGEYPPRSDGL